MPHNISDNDWVEKNFKDNNFNDERLSKRLVKISKHIAARPESSIPKQMECWEDTKACYNFLRNKKVSHKKIQQTHKAKVLEAIKNDKVTLFAQDTSDLDYTNLKTLKNAGYIGNHKGKGFMFHSCLAIRPHALNPGVVGLVNQIIWTRKDESLNTKETRNDRNKRSKESDVWLKNLKNIGSPLSGCTWVSLGDRANDIYEYFLGAQKLGWESVVRVCQGRKITAEGKQTDTLKHIRSLPATDTKEISIRKKGETKERQITLSVSWESAVTVHAPSRLSRKTPTVSLSVVRCWNDEEDIEWILYSSILVTNINEALEKIEWYSCRWLIEEYHKCIKTGCKAEHSQLEDGKALKNLIGILSIISILMLKLRNIAREASERPAAEIIDEGALKIITKRYELKPSISVNVFWKSVAKLGGFLGRKNDGEPGWQALWHGWLRLLDMLWGYKVVSDC